MANAFIEPAKPPRRMRFSYRDSLQRKLAEPNILHFAGANDYVMKARIADAFGSVEGAKVMLAVEGIYPKLSVD